MGKNQGIYKENGQVISFNQLADFFYKKGMRAYKGQKLQDAIKYFRRAAQSEKEPFILCQLATVLSEAGEYQESNQTFFKLVRSNPELEHAIILLQIIMHIWGYFSRRKSMQIAI